MQRILVTGGAGFIGSHTTFNLLQKGYKVIIVDSYANSSESSILNLKSLIKKVNSSLIKNLSFYRGDIRQKDFVEEIFSRSLIDGSPIKGVIHFAGLKAVAESVKDPLKYWDYNFVGTLRLLEIMDKFDCRTIIFSSSATIYGFPQKSLINENSNINPINPYGFNKSTIEILLKNLFDSNPNSWRVANLRYFNPIGAHDTGLIGENPKGIPNNIFPFINKVASKEINELKIFGKDWDTHDGTGVRDYIHVMDLAEGHILSLEFLMKNDSQIINLNLGTGKGTSVLELVKIFEKINNVKVPYVFTKRREGDVGNLVADNSLATSILNWQPKRNLYEMCAHGWRWQLNSMK
tara:strand:+ start:33557 stop:34603 length:1047 start_codon:yes stop_codon:yes gene_type:complete